MLCLRHNRPAATWRNVHETNLALTSHSALHVVRLRTDPDAGRNSNANSAQPSHRDSYAVARYRNADEDPDLSLVSGS